MKPFSFIHAADLHLGSPFKGVGASLPEAAVQLRHATFDAFSGLMDLCLEKSVDFLLVAGDVFDISDRSLRAQLTFRDGLARLSDSGIRSFTVLGNHDPWDSWSSRISWPENAHIFSPEEVETRVVSIDDTPVAAVSGISYRTRQTPEDLSLQFRADRPDLYQIALLHGNCGQQPDHGAYAPCMLTALQKSGFDYWALGHVHEKKILSPRPSIVYPGCLQGLSIREPGAHGCWHVDVDENGQATLTFFPLDRLRWQMAELSITGIDTLDDLDQALGQSLAQNAETGAGRPVIVRIRISGSGPLYPQLRQPSVVQELLERARDLGALQSPTVWVQDMAVDCRPEIDLRLRSTMDDLLGQVLRGAATLGDAPDALVETLMPVLSELYQHTRLAGYLDPPATDDLLALLQDAALICYDQLESDT